MQKINFQNLPNTTSPLNATNMNLLQDNVEDVFNGDEAMGNVVVDSIRSKNMLNINSFAKGRINTTTGNPEYPDRVSTLTIGSNSVLITTTQSWSGIHSQYIEVDANETYNLSFTTTNASSSWGGLVCYGSSLNYLGEATKTIISSSTNASYNFALLANTKYIRVVLQNTSATTITYSNLQLEKGSTTTSYSPYQNLKNSTNYSLEEVRTNNIWINGKPIYRKVVTFNARTDVLETNYAHNIQNVDEFLPTSNCISYRTNGAIIPLSMVYPASTNNIVVWSCGWQVGTNITIWIGENMRAQLDTSRGYNTLAILEYTKTTD